jgi:hypothetical protein
LVNRDFEGAAKYSDWKFVYSPATQQVPVPTSGPQGTAPPQQQVPTTGTQVPTMGMPPR